MAHRIAPAFVTVIAPLVPLVLHARVEDVWRAVSAALTGLLGSWVTVPPEPRGRRA